MKLLGCLLLLAAGLAAGERMRYDNHKIVQFKIKNDEQLQQMMELEENNNGITFMDPPNISGTDLEAVVSPLDFQKFSEVANKIGMDFTVTEDNLQRLLDLERPPRQGKAVTFDWENYNTLDEIYEWLDQIQAEFPDKVTLLNIGSSFEGRDLKLVKISSKKPGNRAMFIEANIHAREWISSATATYLINQLLTSTDPAVMDIAENIDWHIIPVMNPDGFSYSHTDVRLWRKTRSKHSVICVGVDANRNFDFHYMENQGASKVKCSETYAGPDPFSEIEAVRLREYYSTIFEKVDIYLSFHSAATMLLYPYGHTLDPAPNDDVLYDVAEHAVQALQQRYSTVYTFGTTIELLYPASGTSVDYMYGTFGTPLAYTYEFRNRLYSFILPPEFIIPNSEEILDSILGMVARARTHGYLQVTP